MRPQLTAFVVLLAAPAAADEEGVEGEVITVRRAREPIRQTPAAVTVVDMEDAFDSRQEVGLDEALVQVPGVFFQNRFNFAQDLRVSIRGFGARAGFGIRGLRLVVDDIPLTLPDGQAGIDTIDLGALDRAEVIRGPSSALYGASAGGVVQLQSSMPDAPEIMARTSVGSFGTTRSRLEVGDRRGEWAGTASASTTRVGGYRDHARNLSHTLHLGTRVGDARQALTASLDGVHSPHADDPGGLTANEVAADRRAARDRNLVFDAGEALDQLRGGLGFRERRGLVEWGFRLFGAGQTLESRIPNPGSVQASSGGWIELGRLHSGLSAEMSLPIRFGFDHQLATGIELARQDDDRRRYVNDEGVRGALTLDQDERVLAAGWFVRDEVQLGRGWLVSAGVRADAVAFEIEDRFVANLSGDDSGQRTFTQLSPSLGVSFSAWERLQPYAALTTGFETPTTTELANPGGGGFAPELDSMRARSLDVGARGGGRQWRYDLSLYRITTDDEIVPYMITGDERTFFRNAGSTRRIGAEARIDVAITDGLRALGTYTLARYRYHRFATDDEVYDGNRLPGQPAHSGYLRVDYQRGDVRLSGDGLFVGALYADDANTARVSGYAVFSVTAAYAISTGPLRIRPFAGVGNLGGSRYHSNIRINAQGGRYFEPAPLRNLYAGLEVAFSPR